MGSPQETGCPDKNRVEVVGKLSDWFDLTTGVAQGAVASTVLFNMYIAAIFEVMGKRIEEHNAENMDPASKIKGVNITYDLR